MYSSILSISLSLLACGDKPNEPQNTLEDTGSVEDLADTGSEVDTQTYDLSIDVGNNTRLNFSLIPAGQEPKQRYTLSNDFYMLTTEVTQGMYVEVMGYEAYTGQTPSVGQGKDYPAYYISWHMSADFANSLTDFYNSTNNTSLNSCYTCRNSGTVSVECEDLDPYQCDGFRLPTEAEWEYAARSGTTADFWTGEGPELGGNYSNDECESVSILDGIGNPPLTEYAWFCGNSDESSEPVGGKLPNGYGLYDMHGNVWEWTADQGSFDYECVFPNGDIDPYCNTGDFRVIRGGYWNKRPDFLKSSYSFSGSPDSRNKYIGTRLVRSK